MRESQSQEGVIILSGFTYNGHQLLNATSVYLDSHDICKSCLCSSGGTCSSNADPPITSTVCSVSVSLM